MKLQKLINYILAKNGSCNLSQWMLDCLGTNKQIHIDPLKIEDFSGDITPKIICLNFIKEIKCNRLQNKFFLKIVLHLEDYLAQNRHPDPMFKIRGFTKYLSEKSPDLLCTGKPIKIKRPLNFSTITTMEDVFKYNVGQGSGEPLEDINEGNIEKKIKAIDDFSRKRRMLPIRTGLPLFWCTLTSSIDKAVKTENDKPNYIRDVLGLSQKKQGYLVNFRLSNDYIDTPRKPVFFESGPPNEYFYVTDAHLRYGRTRSLADLTVTQFREVVHKEKEWPHDHEYKIEPLGKVKPPPEPSVASWEAALKHLWDELLTNYPTLVLEIRNL